MHVLYPWIHEHIERWGSWCFYSPVFSVERAVRLSLCSPELR